MLLHIGHRNYISVEKVLAVTTMDSAPLKRQKQKAEDLGKAIDCTAGRKTLSLIHLSGGYIVQSSVKPETLKERIKEGV